MPNPVCGPSPRSPAFWAQSDPKCPRDAHLWGTCHRSTRCFLGIGGRQTLQGGLVELSAALVVVGALVTLVVTLGGDTGGGDSFMGRRAAWAGGRRVTHMHAWHVDRVVRNDSQYVHTPDALISNRLDGSPLGHPSSTTGRLASRYKQTACTAPQYFSVCLAITRARARVTCRHTCMYLHVDDLRS